jgi:hypothetical protein
MLTTSSSFPPHRLLRRLVRSRQLHIPPTPNISTPSHPTSRAHHLRLHRKHVPRTMPAILFVHCSHARYPPYKVLPRGRIGGRPGSHIRELQIHGQRDVLELASVQRYDGGECDFQCGVVDDEDGNVEWSVWQSCEVVMWPVVY